MIKKILNNDFVLSFIKKFSNIFLGFLTLIFLNRFLGADLKGEYSYVLNYTSIISIIFQFGISAVYSQFKRKKIDNCYSIFISLTIIQFLLYLVLSLIIILVCDLDLTIILITLVSTISILTSQIRYISLVEYYKFNSYSVIIMSIVNFFAMFLAYLFCKPSILIAFMVLIIKDLSIILILGRKIKFKLLFKKEYSHIYKDILIKGSLPMLSSLLIILNYKIDVIMLKYMNVDFYQIGLYSVGLSLAEYIWLIPEIFKDVIQKRTSVDNSTESINFSLRISSTIVIFVFIIMFVFGKLILNIFFGSEYVGAYAVTNVLFIGIYSMIFYKIVGTLFIADNKSKIYFIILLLGAIINLTMNLLLIPKYEIIGAALASVVSYSAIGVLFMIIYTRNYNVNIKDLLFIQKKDIKKLKKFVTKTSIKEDK